MYSANINEGGNSTNKGPSVKNVKNEWVIKSTHCFILNNVNTNNAYFRAKINVNVN